MTPAYTSLDDPQSEERWLFALAASDLGVWDWNIEADEVFFSERLFTMLGYEAGELSQNMQEWTTRVHPDDLDATLRNVRDQLDGRTSIYEAEYRLRTKDGSYRWILDRGKVVARDDTGRPVRMTGTHIDITERKEMEEALHASLKENAELRAALDEHAIVAITDATGRITFVNDKFCAISQYHREELLGQDHRMINSGYHSKEFMRQLWKTIESGRVWHGEIKNRAKDGSFYWVDTTIVPFLDDDGKPRQYIAIRADITERKQAEEAVRHHEQILQETGRIAKVGGWEFDTATGQGTWTDEVARIHDAEPGVGVDLEGGLKFYEPSSRTRVEAALKNAIEEGIPYDLELELRTAKGQLKTIRTIGHPIVENGKVVKMRGAFQDVTEHKDAEAHLKVLETCVAHLNDIVLITEAEPIDEPGPRILYVNEAFVRRTGYTREEVIGRSPRFLQGPKTQQDALQRIREAMRQWQPCREELINYKKSGEEFWLELDLVPVADSTGWFTHWVAIERDITERKHAEQLARATDERFHLLAQATNDAVWDWDMAAGRVWWNEGYEKLFGYRKGEISPSVKTWGDFIHPEDRDRVLWSVGQAVEGQINRWTDEYRFRRRDGSYAFVMDRGQIIRDASGKAIRMIGGMTDLTERKRAEEKLHEQATLLDKARDAILVRDLHHRILYWNQSAERHYGWTADEAVGCSIVDLLYDDPTEFLAATEATIKNGEWVGELEQKTRDGRVLTVRAHWSLMRDGGNRPDSILAINTDITEQKQLEQQFLRAQRMESIGTLAGGIAHDLNNVLGPILLSLELLQMRFTDPASQELLGLIETSATRGAQMVKQVLTFARGVEGQRLVVQPRQLIQEIEKIANDTFLKNIQVRTVVPSTLWTMVGDATQLHQVLLNLCVNARDAMPHGGTLTISAENLILDEQYAGLNIEAKPGPYIRVQVQDTGTGMGPETVERIFDPFFTTKEIGKGTGLGLSTSLAIVKSHQGFVRVSSKLGRGTTFEIYLPAQTDETPAQQKLAREELPRGNNELILVVDDERPVREITRQTLETFGYRVLLAVDGTEAIALYAKHQAEIAAVITDMMMPGLDGPATIQILRRMNPALRIVAASGVTTNGHAAKVASCGVKYFLAKPYTAGTMLQVLKELLAEP